MVASLYDYNTRILKRNNLIGDYSVLHHELDICNFDNVHIETTNHVKSNIRNLNNQCAVYFA